MGMERMYLLSVKQINHLKKIKKTVTEFQGLVGYSLKDIRECLIFTRKLLNHINLI